MLHDLTTNYKLVGLSYNQLIDLLGKPGNYAVADSSKLYYIVLEDYGFDIDPRFQDELGYTVSIVFIFLDNEELCIERIDPRIIGLNTLTL